MIEVINTIYHWFISLLVQIGSYDLYLGEGIGSIKLITLWIFLFLVRYLGKYIKLIFNKSTDIKGGVRFGRKRGNNTGE